MTSHLVQLITKVSTRNPIHPASSSAAPSPNILHPSHRHHSNTLSLHQTTRLRTMLTFLTRRGAGIGYLGQSTSSRTRGFPCVISGHPWVPSLIRQDVI